MSNFSLVGYRFWLDFQWFYKFFIGSFHLQEVFLRYVWRLWKIDALLVVLILKLHFKRFPVAYYINYFFMLSLLSSFSLLWLHYLLARAALYTLRFLLCIFYEHRRKDERFNTSYFWNGCFYSQHPARKIYVCICDEYILNCSFPPGQGCKYLVLHFYSYQSQKSFNPNTDH